VLLEIKHHALDDVTFVVDLESTDTGNVCPFVVEKVPKLVVDDHQQGMMG